MGLVSGARKMLSSSAEVADERSAIGDVRQCGYCNSFFLGGPTDFVAPRSSSPPAVPSPTGVVMGVSGARQMPANAAPASPAPAPSDRHHHAPNAGEDGLHGGAASGPLLFTTGGQALEQMEGAEACAQGESADHHHLRRRPRGNRGGWRRHTGQAPSGFQ